MCNLVSCSLSPLLSLKTPLVVSLQRTTCIHVGAASRLPLVFASFRNSFTTESSVQNSVLLQCILPDIGTKALLQEPFESFTDQLFSDMHVGSKWFSFGHSYARASAQVFKWFLPVSMVYVLCYPFNVSILLHCCLCFSLELSSKGGARNVKVLGFSVFDDLILYTCLSLKHVICHIPLTIWVRGGIRVILWLWHV